MTPGLETYEEGLVHIATIASEGITDDHVDMVSHGIFDSFGYLDPGTGYLQRRYSVLVRTNYEDGRWTNTRLVVSRLSYAKVLEIALELSEDEGLPLLLEGNNVCGYRLIKWHPEGWKPKKGSPPAELFYESAFTWKNHSF